MQKTLKKHQGISVSELLSLIPDQELVRLAKETKVDYYSKVLYGRSVFRLRSITIFYMLLMGLLSSARASLRVLEDVFNLKSFKTIFNLTPSKTVKYNSISGRLGVMKVEFFEKAFEFFYAQLSQLYSQDEMLTQKIVRVDSTMVAETSAKLLEGMCVGCKKDGKKQTKFTIAFDGIFPCDVEVYSRQADLSEDRAIPAVVLSCAEKYTGKIYIFDRGVQKRETFDGLSKGKIEFVCRLKESSRREVVRTMETGNGRPIGSLFLVSDEEVRLFGTRNRKPTEKTFRLITAVNISTGSITATKETNICF